MQKKQTVIYLFFILAAFLTVSPLAAQPQDFSNALELLKEGNFNKKAEAVTAIAASGHERAKVLLQAMLSANLFYRKEDKRLVIGEEHDAGYQIRDAISDEALGITEKHTLKKIGINNKLRRLLRSNIATLSLGNPNATVRLAAVEQMTGKLNADDAATLRTYLEKEKDKDVRSAMQIALAVDDLANPGTAGARLAAVKVLQGSLLPQARNRLQAIVDQAANSGETTEVRKAAQAALQQIEFRLQLYSLTETLFFGLSLGSVLVLAAIGLAITFGVMGVINMAHGELIMIGAYTTYVMQLLLPNHIGLSIILAIPAAFIVAGLFGIAIERGVIRFLYGRPLETLLATFGISLVLQQLVRSVFSPLNRSVSTPDWMSGSLEINSVLSITYNRLYILIFCIMVFFALLAVLKRTRLGLEVRAVSQNRQMARAIGIRSARVDALTFGLGSGIAGVAGVALSQLTNVGPNMGQSYIIDSFMVVVFGGAGNLWGTLVGGLSLGIANKFLEPYAGAVLAKVLILVFIILFIQKRPRGLFPQKGRAAEN